MHKNTLLSSADSGFTSLLKTAPEVDRGIISRAVLTTPTLRVTLFNFSAGQELSEHTSKARALVQILSGSCHFSFAGTTHLLKAGDLLHLPPRAPHAVTAPEAFSMLLTQVTEPAA